MPCFGCLSLCRCICRCARPPLQTIAVMALCVAGSAVVTAAPPPPEPVSGLSWGWWVFLATCSFANIRILSEIWPRDLQRRTAEAATTHAALIEHSFPADFASGSAAPATALMLSSTSWSQPFVPSARTPFDAPLSASARSHVPTDPATQRYQTQLRWCALVYVAGCGVRAVWPRIDVERERAPSNACDAALRHAPSCHDSPTPLSDSH